MRPSKRSPSGPLSGRARAWERRGTRALRQAGCPVDAGFRCCPHNVIVLVCTVAWLRYAPAIERRPSHVGPPQVLTASNSPLPTHYALHSLLHPVPRQSESAVFTEFPAPTPSSSPPGAVSVAPAEVPPTTARRPNPPCPHRPQLFPRPLGPAAENQEHLTFRLERTRTSPPCPRLLASK